MGMKGTTGKTSRTVILNIIMAVLGQITGAVAMIQGMVAPEIYVAIFMGLNAIHAGLGVYLRSLTKGPLQ